MALLFLAIDYFVGHFLSHEDFSLFFFLPSPRGHLGFLFFLGDREFFFLPSSFLGSRPALGHVLALAAAETHWSAAISKMELLTKMQ